MPGLLDVAHSTRTVDINGVAVSVPGVSAKGVAILFARFPVFRELFSGREPDLSVEAIASLAPEVIAAVIAAGTGAPGDAETEAVAANLPALAQVELIQAILDVTMPGGIGPFVERLTAAMAGVSGQDTSIPDTKSQPALKLS